MLRKMMLSHTKKLTITSICVALCVVLPVAFHAIPGGGNLFSPMHIPVLLCGLVCGGGFGLLCGAVGPVVSALVTGMPGPAYLPAMVVELSLYGLAAGTMMRLVRSGRWAVDVYTSLLVAMVLGRIGGGLANAFIFNMGVYSIAIWVSSYVTGTLPGAALHLVVVPTILATLEKARLIPRRYAKAG